jgi:hypothetical protein
VRTETVVERGPDGTENVQERTIVDGEVLATLTETWSIDTLEATGMAPLLERYPDANRNRMLAREAAVVQAQVQLGQLVGETEVVQNVTVNDLAASQVAQSRLRAVLRGHFVILERFNEPENRYEVTIGLPKARVLEVITEVVRRD